MRLELDFELKSNIFVSDYRNIFISFLKNSITQCGNDYYHRYFEDAVSKDYTFSVIFDKPQFQGETIQLQNKRIKMLFSASNQAQTGLIFFNAFIMQKNKEFLLPNGNGMTLKRITEKKEFNIESRKVIFRIVGGSGLCIRNHCKETNKDRYFVFADDSFEQEAKYVLKRQVLEANFSKSMAEDIHIKPVQWKKVVVKHYKMCIDVSVGLFEMEAHPDILQYFYQAGIGSRHSAGFGMVDLVTQDLL